MSNIAIKVENLGKKYLIKHQQKESYQTFQDMLLNGSKRVINSLNPLHRKNSILGCPVNSFEVANWDNELIDFLLVEFTL